MPLDGVMLGFAARELDTQLAGGRVQKITQPERDELVLTVRSLGEMRQLLYTANAASPRLQLITSRRSNPLEPSAFLMMLRKRLNAARVLSVRQVGGDRVVDTELEIVDEMGDVVRRTLVIECMGKYSNIILVGNGKILESARRVSEEMSRVREVLPGLPYERPLSDKLPYDALDGAVLAEKLATHAGEAAWKALSACVSGLSRQTAREISVRFDGDPDLRLMEPERYAFFAASFLRNMASIKSPRVVRDADGSLLDVTPFPYLQYAQLPQEEFSTISQALEAFYEGRDRAERIAQRSTALRRTLKTHLERCERKLALQADARKDADKMEEYRIRGELLTAHLGQIPRGADKIALPNYYDPEGGDMEIPLDVKLSPAANAQRYVKLYQKAKSAQRLAQEQIEKTSAEIEYLENQLYNLDRCEGESELAEIRAELAHLGYVKENTSRRQQKSLPPSQPLKFTAPDGTVILVGKNNLQNDKITGEARPEETWLHVKDMPGSHVIVISERPSQETLLFAASLAARYSKGANNAKTPVDYTKRKYVKKPSGAKPGFVIYTHQRTIMAEPMREDL